ALDGAFETIAAAPMPVVVPSGGRRMFWPAAVVVVALAAAGLTWALSRPTVQPPVPTRFSLVLPTGDQLTFAAGTMVIVSPDGQTLAYRAARGGNIRLFVRRIDQLEAQMISDQGTGESPFFSPDGEWIAYTSSGVLKKVPARGGPSETINQLPEAIRGGDWSTDGTIALAGNRLHTVPATGGTPTLLATAPEGRRLWYPQFIAGGRAILYTSSGPRPDSGDIEVIDVATKKSRKLLAGALSRLLPTGHLVFVRSGTLWAVKFDESTLQVQGTPVPMIEGIRVEGGGAVQYSVGADGTLMYIPGANSAASHLVWVDRAGRQTPLPVTPRTFYSVRLDPASEMAALDLRDSTDGADIWMLPLARQTPTRVTIDPGEDSLPTWMADGRLGFTSNRDGAVSLFAQSPDGTGKVAKLIDDTKVTVDQPAASPEGKFIVARSNEDIVIVSLADKTLRKLIESPFRERNPEISRDGRWIAYQSDESGAPEIYVRPFPNVDAPGKWLVSEGGGSRPVWARNGKELFYLGPDSVLMSVAFDATNGAFRAAAPTRLGTMPMTPGAHRAFDVAKDDERFLTIKGETNSERAEITVVQHWTEELKKKLP
ncbi:MAG TPA: hypothetical protein VM846_17315, partial [Vicinamibacterales bacterium]|nr:hypothetical protein [Vicinamibacterales bacterium]